jgi:hypothetical protein
METWLAGGTSSVVCHHPATLRNCPVIEGFICVGVSVKKG